MPLSACPFPGGGKLAWTNSELPLTGVSCCWKSPAHSQLGTLQTVPQNSCRQWAGVVGVWVPTWGHQETCPAPRFPSCWLFLSLMSKHELCLGKRRKKLHGILCTNTVAMGRQCPSMPGSIGHRTNSALLGWTGLHGSWSRQCSSKQGSIDLQPPWIPCTPGGEQQSPPCSLPSLETVSSHVCGLPCY